MRLFIQLICIICLFSNFPTTSFADPGPDGKIVKKTYVKDGIQITYPQFVSFHSEDGMKRVNEILKKEALEIAKPYTNQSNVSIHIDYVISLRNDSVISVQYSGTSYVKGAAHPINLFYSINVDLKKGKKLYLRDMISINKVFIGEIRQNARPLQTNQASVLRDLSDDTLQQFLLRADDCIFSDIHIYFTSTHLGIVISTSHALGDYAKFEMPHPKEVIPFIK